MSSGRVLMKKRWKTYRLTRLFLAGVASTKTWAGSPEEVSAKIAAGLSSAQAKAGELTGEFKRQQEKRKRESPGVSLERNSACLEVQKILLRETVQAVSKCMAYDEVGYSGFE